MLDIVPFLFHIERDRFGLSTDAVRVGAICSFETTGIPHPLFAMTLSTG